MVRRGGGGVAWGEGFKEHWRVDKQEAGKEGVSEQGMARVWGILAIYVGIEGTYH